MNDEEAKKRLARARRRRQMRDEKWAARHPKGVEQPKPTFDRDEHGLKYRIVTRASRTASASSQCRCSAVFTAPTARLAIRARRDHELRVHAERAA